MAFIETPVFPDSLAAGSVFGPGFSTRVVRNGGGYEQRNKRWTAPLYEGDLSKGIQSQEDLDDVLAFFHYVAGMHSGFRFRHWGDYEATGTQGTVVQLTETTWQMYKTRTFGALSTPWKVSKPRAGCAINGAGSYSYDQTTGIITALGSPVDAPTGWTGEFDFPVRFNTDKMLPEAISFELYDWSAIPIVELRLR